MQAAGSYGFRFRVRRPDGGITHLHSQWAVKNGPDGQPDRVIGIMVDDTEVVRLTRSHIELESHLALAGTLSGLVVWRQDLKTDLIRFNDEGYALMQLAPGPDGVAGEAVRARVHPDDLPGVRASVDLAMNSRQSVDVEARYAQDDGSWHRLLTRRVVQRNEAGRPVAVLGVALDITARDEESRRTRELSERFDLATRTAGIGYWSREGSALRAYWSDQMRALHGLSTHDTVPTLKEWVDQFVHVDDRAAIRQGFREWLSGRVPGVQAEVRIVRRDGSERHLMTHSLQERGGATPVLFGIAIDITDRRLADIALRRADERAALAARGAGIGTWEYDRRDGGVFWDEAMWRLRGRAPRAQAPSLDELVSFVHPDDRAAMAQAVDRVRDVDEVMDHGFRVVWPDGTVRWLASRSTSLRDAQGQTVRRIGVNWDVTAAREAEAERSERLAAERANQAKSRFLARMSHELRTPLNAVLGFTQLLMMDDTADQRPVRLQHVHSAGRHLLSLIDDVLDLAGLETGDLRINPEPVDLAALVADTLPLLEPLRKQHGLTTAVDVPPLAVMADPLRLRQVLLNLLSNACKYNRAGGQVQVRAQVASGEVLIVIEDQGRGMTDAQLRQLYEPFNRLGIESEGIEGTGIGLTIVKALVERMGGSVQLHSQIGLGTRAEVRLPAATGPDVPAATATRAGPEAGGLLDARRGVLYIEDNAVNALIVRELLLRRPDIELHLAADGASGLAAAHRERPALVLLDMQLPDMDGLLVLAQLRADPATADLPCIALSANALPDDMSRALAAGMAAYWTKPLDVAEFSRAIDALFGPPA